MSNRELSTAGWRAPALASLIAVIVLVSVVASITMSASQPEYWAKYNMEIHNKDKSYDVIIYVFVDLSDPHFPDYNITGVKIVAGAHQDDIPDIKDSADILISYLIDFFKDPSKLPSNGVVETTKYNVSLYEVYDTQTGLLKYVKASREGTPNIVEMKLVDTNVKPGWLGEETETTSTTTGTPVTSTASTSSGVGGPSTLVSNGQYVKYHLEFNVIDKDSGDKLEGSGDVKIVLEVESDGSIGASDVKVSNVKVASLPEGTDEDQFKQFLGNFITYYVPLWVDPSKLDSSGRYTDTVGKMKLVAFYDTKTGLLKEANLVPASSDVEGSVKISLMDTDVNSLKAAASSGTPSGSAGVPFALIIGVAIAVAAVIAVLAIIMKRRSRTRIQGAYGPAYPPPPGTPPPPPG